MSELGVLPVAAAGLVDGVALGVERELVGEGSGQVDVVALCEAEYQEEHGGRSAEWRVEPTVSRTLDLLNARRLRGIRVRACRFVNVRNLRDAPVPRGRLRTVTHRRTRTEPAQPSSLSNVATCFTCLLFSLAHCAVIASPVELSPSPFRAPQRDCAGAPAPYPRVLG